AAGELARRDLARRLHDDVLPGLASAGMMLDLAPARPELLSRARESVGDGMTRIRSVLDELLPDEIDAAGLPAALRALAATGEPVAVVEIGATGGLGDRPAVLLHRMAGELLRNARAHASAGRITVQLAVAGDLARLTVSDDGTGFRPDARPAPGHVGLPLVRRAAEDAGGRVSVRSSPGAGTEVVVEVPAA
ncbi:sensor histidine kinase, partial [Pseudonocardia saturnea]